MSSFTAETALHQDTCDLMMQLTMAALWCTNLYSGAWSAHASVLTVLASLALWVQGPHRPKASMWGVKSKVGLLILKNRKTGVWDTDINVLELGWGGVTVCLSPAGVFWGLAVLEGRCPLHLHFWLKSAQLESKGMAVLLGWGWCGGYWTKPQRSSTSTTLTSATELKWFVIMDSAPVTGGTLWGCHVLLHLR